MKYLIDTDDEGWNFWLTTDHPESFEGIPVLLYQGEGFSLVFKPQIKLSDSMRMPAHLDANLKIVRDPPRFDTAAQLVADWGSEIERSDEEIEGARKFCESWPEGPQVS
jgi:hypothetical protein